MDSLSHRQRTLVVFAGSKGHTVLRKEIVLAVAAHSREDDGLAADGGQGCVELARGRSRSDDVFLRTDEDGKRVHVDSRRTCVLGGELEDGELRCGLGGDRQPRSRGLDGALWFADLGCHFCVLRLNSVDGLIIVDCFRLSVAHGCD